MATVYSVGAYTQCIPAANLPLYCVWELAGRIGGANVQVDSRDVGTRRGGMEGGLSGDR